MKRCIVCLQQLELFQGLEQEQFASLCHCTTRKKLPRGGCLFRQGETTSAIFLIKSGKLKLVQTAEDGREVILDVCGPGEVLGELSLCREQEDPSSAIAMEETCVCCFSKQQFEALIRHDPSFAVRIIGYLGQKRYDSIVKTGQEAGQTVKERLLRRFYSLAEQYGRQGTGSTVIDLQVTQQELAEMIGSSRVMVVKALKELQAANIIGRQKRRYVLKADPCISIHSFE